MKKGSSCNLNPNMCVVILPHCIYRDRIHLGCSCMRDMLLLLARCSTVRSEVYTVPYLPLPALLRPIHPTCVISHPGTVWFCPISFHLNLYIIKLSC